MGDIAVLITTIIGCLLTWTLTIVGFATWLSGKFRDVERLVYKEMDKHRKDDDKQFNRLWVKVQRLEIRAFGFTQHDKELPEIIED